MFSPTIRLESSSRVDKTAIDLFLSGAKWLGRGSGAAVWMIGKQV
jgi:hypothetical protein